MRARYRVRKEEERLAGMKEPFYSRDHVGFKTEIWKEHLSEFACRDGLWMLEIGSYEGRSALWFMENILTGSGCRLTCVDPWSPQLKLRFDHNIRVAGAADRIRAIQKGSAYALTEDLVNETFDLIYIDGSHRAPDVLFDAVFAWPLLAPGGMMIFDDYEWKPELHSAERPKPAIDRFMEMFQDELEVVDIGFQVLVRKIE
jgi:predicted O-methyltransferase YrrM